MGLFKKKKPREIREEDSTFVKLWYNPRTHALMVLGAYFVFFLIVIIIINVSARKTTNNEVKGSILQDKFTILDNQDLSYNYVINIDKDTYYFQGTNKYNNVYGTLLNNGETSSIKVENNECFVGEYNDTNEFIGMFELCPDKINYTNFDYNYIYKIIDNLKTDNYKTDEYYEFKTSDSTSYKIYTSKDKVDKVIITTDKNTYTLEYNVNEIENSNNE